jgi:hypothetical protein
VGKRALQKAKSVRLDHNFRLLANVLGKLSLAGRRGHRPLLVAVASVQAVLYRSLRELSRRPWFESAVQGAQL